MSASHRCGLNAILIEWFAAAVGQPDLQHLIAALLQVTGAYSISGHILAHGYHVPSASMDLVDGLLRPQPHVHTS